ncbi:MAG: prepilin-type N-terminal cleavage/methylation domain-containing protein [Bacilli bacterium]|nr:prepilin-type N-terminal cleavage/methylation domain-containing protein [Bacilli bacterium]MBP3634900.1 prepilin-type N-terminal cleavage/methylation domain-containing protein [Bacilli bacterium]
MYKNNRGFTLVELLAVILLLVIILLMSYPNFSKLTENAKSRYDNSIKVLAISAAKMYVNNNTDEINNYFEINKEKAYCLPLAKLAAYDYIDSDLKDSSDNIVDMKTCVNVTKENINEKVKYKYELGSGKVAGGVDYLPPILTISNKAGGSLECMESMNVSKYEFDLNCEVVAKDDTDENVFIKETQNNTNTIITYTAVDSSGNKSKPLKVKLITR